MSFSEADFIAFVRTGARNCPRVEGRCFDSPAVNSTGAASPGWPPVWAPGLGPDWAGRVRSTTRSAAAGGCAGGAFPGLTDLAMAAYGAAVRWLWCAPTAPGPAREGSAAVGGGSSPKRGRRIFFTSPENDNDSNVVRIGHKSMNISYLCKTPFCLVRSAPRH